MELRRADLPGLAVTFVELDTLVRSVLPGARKPGLFAAAQELGIPYGGRRSPLAEADLAARVVERLRQRQAASPARALFEGSPGSTGPPVLPFTREWLEGVPDGPGVYLVEDAAGTTLYVGKASGLRRRLSAYVARHPSLHRRFEALGVRAAAVTTIETASDLEAMLLEATLIRDRTPPFNVAQATRGSRILVRAAPDERSPSLRLVTVASADGARYFGPFASESAARKLLATVRAAIPDAFARRRRDVDACRLLSGQKAPIISELRQAMQRAAADGEQARVDRLRATLHGVQGLSLRPSMLAGRPGNWQLLVLEHLATGANRLHLIADGWLAHSVPWEASALPDEPARLAELADQVRASRAKEAPISERRSADHDEPAVILRWLAQAKARLEIARVPSSWERGHSDPGGQAGRAPDGSPSSRPGSAPPVCVGQPSGA
jgi:hypothetical protein